MAAVTAAVIAGAALAYTVSESEQQKRLAGQEKNRQEHSAQVAETKLKEREASEEAIANRDRQRADQRRRVSSLRAGARTPSPADAPIVTPDSGQALLGV